MITPQDVPEPDLVFPVNHPDAPKWARQADKVQQIIPFVTNFNLAVDGGAMVGVWTLELLKHFRHVDAYEPIDSNADCLVKNLIERAPCDHNRVSVYRMALGDKPQDVAFDLEPAPVSHHVHVKSKVRVADVTVPMVPLDQFSYLNVGLIKLDLEGYELPALRGAEQTINRSQPVVVVEMKNAGKRYGFDDQAIRDWFRDRNYKLVLRLYPDEVYVPDI